MNDLTITKLDNSLTAPGKFEHYLGVAEKLSTSSLIPKHYIGKPADIFIAMDYGVSLGMAPLQALQDIAVINGRPCLWGDALLAVAQAHPDYEFITESFLYDEKNIITAAECIIKRRGHEPHRRTFSLQDAKTAGLLNKSGPWLQYPSRMMQLRARGFAIRNTFADALRGIHSAEEQRDIEYIEGVAVEVKGRSKTDRLKDQIKGQLTSKKGNTNAKSSSLITDTSHDTNPIHTLSGLQATDVVVHHEEGYGADELRSSTGREQESDSEDSTGEARKATQDQLMTIDTLMSDKKFDEKRKAAMLKFSKVDSLDDLTVNQADLLIDKLDKLP